VASFFLFPALKGGKKALELNIKNVSENSSPFRGGVKLFSIEINKSNA
jgi:hypothetical protein